jgi:hypothetical protein
MKFLINFELVIDYFKELKNNIVVRLQFFLFDQHTFAFFCDLCVEKHRMVNVFLDDPDDLFMLL